MSTNHGETDTVHATLREMEADLIDEGAYA